MSVNVRVGVSVPRVPLAHWLRFDSSTMNGKCTSSLLQLHKNIGTIRTTTSRFILFCLGSSIHSPGLFRQTPVPYIIMSNYSHFATNAIHVGSEPDQWKCHAVVPPIFLSTTFEEKEPAVTYVRFCRQF